MKETLRASKIAPAWRGFPERCCPFVTNPACPWSTGADNQQKADFFGDANLLPDRHACGGLAEEALYSSQKHLVAQAGSAQCKDNREMENFT